MKTRIIHMVFMAVTTLFLTGCEPSEEAEPKINILEPTEVTESTFIAHWEVKDGTPVDIRVQLCCSPDFVEIYKDATMEDPLQTSYHFEGLDGATKYYCRVRGTVDADGKPKTLQSGHTVIQTGYQSENADVVTEDGIHIAGNLYYLSTTPQESPAMILMGHFSISNMWKAEDLFLDLVRQGYVCYIFNYRGHAGSDYWDIFPQGLTPEEQLAWMEEFITQYVSRDLEACYEYLRQHPLVDSTHIGLIGGSLGSNMSMFANNWPGIKVSVGLTTSRLGLDNAGTLHNVLFLASEQGSNQFYNYEEEAWYLYDHSADPKKVIIVSGDFHGIDMLVKSSLKGEILEWINARMVD